MRFSNEQLEKFKKYNDLRQEIFSKEEQKELDSEIKLEITAMSELVIIEAKETLYYLSHNEKERAIYAARKKYQLDFNSAVHAAELNTARRVAIKMKLKNEPIEKIIEFTELSRAEIEKL